MVEQASFVGIDVSKDHLDVTVVPQGESWRMPNTEAGIDAVVEQLRDLEPSWIVLEASGGLEMEPGAGPAAGEASGGCGEPYAGS